MSRDSDENAAGAVPLCNPTSGCTHLRWRGPEVPALSCGSQATGLTGGFPVTSAAAAKCHTGRDDRGCSRPGKGACAHSLSSGFGPEPVPSGRCAGTYTGSLPGRTRPAAEQMGCGEKPRGEEGEKQVPALSQGAVATALASHVCRWDRRDTCASHTERNPPTRHRQE